MSKGGVFWIFILTGQFWSIDITYSGFIRTKFNLILSQQYMKQSNSEVIGGNYTESTADKRERFRDMRENLKLFLIKSTNGREKVTVDKSGGISLKALPHDLKITVENKKWIKPMPEKVQNKNVRFVPVVRKVSARAKEDLEELEEMMKQLENMRKKVIKWSRV